MDTHFTMGFTICYLSFSSLDKLAIPSFFSADKIAHFGMYIILEYFLFIALNKKLKYLVLGTFFVIIFSDSTELIQHYFVTNRFGEWMDFVANLLGVITAYFLIKRKNKT